LFKAQGLLQPYAPANLAAIPAKFRDPAQPPYWFGNSAWICAIIYNEVEGKKREIPPPKTWIDLTDSKYRDQIVMPHPASSGTGFMYVSAWIQTFGEQKAWAFMDVLHANIARYTHSGSAPAVMAARGENVVGLAFELRGSRLKQQGAPIEIVLPKEALGWDMNAFGIVSGTKKLYGATRSVVAIPGLAKPVAYMPDDLGDRIMKQDFAWAAKNRDRILAEWESRYGTKAEPRK
jgi:iron(III) transport system substrate-binding protein